MRHNLFFSLVLSLILLNSTHSQSKRFEDKLQSILDKAVSKKNNNLSGIAMAVISPDLHILWAGASGYDSTLKDKELTVEQPFRVASVTKSFVAAAILRLYEDGKLEINDPISKYISNEHQEILKSDNYLPSKITIYHCLTHTSGLFDYAEGSEDYILTALKDPKKRWTRTEQLQFAMKVGEPLGKPGELFGYSDTGYILLGEIIEKVSGMPLAKAMRQLLNYDSLRLNSTWLESLEERPEGLPDPVHRYLEDIDGTEWDNSVDLYGGGGISSTVKDLAVFFNALFNNNIYANDDTIEIMLGDLVNSEPDNSENYGLGLGRGIVSDTIVYLHTGFWGTAWFYTPKYNTTVVINYTNDTSGAGVLKQTIDEIIKLKKSKS